MIHLSTCRPVAVAMAYLALTLLDFAAWRRIPTGLLAGTELPRLTVQAQWSGASPEATESGRSLRKKCGYTTPLQPR